MARRRRGHASPLGSSRRGERKSTKLWLLEGAIVVLVALNGYLLYSVMSTEPSVSAIDHSAETPNFDMQMIQVEVLNGCGVKRVSHQVREYLRNQGFDVVYIGNAENFEFPESVVLDRRAGNEVSAASRVVADALGTQHVIIQRNEDRLVDATVIVGHDYRQLRSFEE